MKILNNRKIEAQENLNILIKMCIKKPFIPLLELQLRDPGN